MILISDESEIRGYEDKKIRFKRKNIQYKERAE